MIHTIEDDIERYVDRYALGFEKGEGSSQFLRVKIPNGVLSTKQLIELAEMAHTYGRGYAEITTRQDLQLHWIDAKKALEVFRDLERIGFTTDKCGQAYPGARYGDIRNIVGCPAAGIDRDEIFDASPILMEVTKFFVGKRIYQDLPRKFKMSISGCARDCTIPYIQDLAFVGVRHRDGRAGFSLYAGGRFGTDPKLAEPLEVFIEPEDTLEAARCLVELYRDQGPRTHKAKARFKFMVESWGKAKLTAYLEEKLGKKLENFKIEHRDCGEHLGVNRQKQEGKSYVTVPIFGGILSNASMLRFAELAERYGSPEVRLTCFQNLILVGVEDGELPQLRKELLLLGFDVEGYPHSWTTIACAANFCSKGIENTKKRALEITKHLESRFGERLRNISLRIAASGCLNGCARHALADIGLQGIAAAKDGGFVPGYNLYLGGGLADNPSLGRTVATAIYADQAGEYVENILSAYFEHRFEGESFRDFCRRHSVDQLTSMALGKLGRGNVG